MSAPPAATWRIRLAPILGTGAWVAIAATGLLLFPWSLLQPPPHPATGSLALASGWLIFNGLGLGLWSAWLLVREGGGSPSSLAPPRSIVATGPYRLVRNPILLGAFLILAGEALLFRSAALAGYLAVAMVAGHLQVSKREEPAMARRFGSCYQQYCLMVPRWIPALPDRAVPRARVHASTRRRVHPRQAS